MSVDESTHNKVLVTATITVQKPNLLESLRTNIADKLHDAYADCWEEAVFALELVNAHEDQPRAGYMKLKMKHTYDGSSKGLGWYISHYFKKFWFAMMKIHSIFYHIIYFIGWCAINFKILRPSLPGKVEFMKYVAQIEVESDFGEVGAVLVENIHHVEMHLIDIVLEGLPSCTAPLKISCNSWVQPNKSSKKRVFFTNKSYLTSQTPNGLRSLREKELESLRGNGQYEERKSFERIYDYDTYNDLGDTKLKRVTLGGNEEFPYPRRCRTGHPIDRGMFKSVYVPRDERFSGLKQEEFGFSTLKARLHSVVPALWTKFLDVDHDFPYMTAVNLLFNEGESNNPEMVHHGTVQDSLPHVIRQVSDETDHILRFELPQSFQRDGFSWFKDEEFARQTLAGMNPLSIKCLKKEDWPLKSKLDPNIYGPPESALKVELVENEIKGSITFDEALKQNKLFIIDYHDAFLPYVNKVSEMEDRNLYGSRTLFIYDGETLKPIAIELTRPPYFDGKIQHKQWKEVFVPRTSATRGWLWKLAKAHVLAHDSSYHQLISHWLRTHCCTEPYIIAANRWLSEMHPIYRLLHPHFRYTMEINALARQALINADGIIEKTFTTGKYSLELCSSIYGSDWRFDREALPEDLKSRGMAVEDSNARHGWKLTIDDYPYAKDGLDLWFILKKWVEDYVHHYYGWDKENKLLENDKELHAWWEDIKTVGHGDKKNETWWPTLETLEGLIDILTTIIWVTSGHHAAVNFGQYAYAGYFPNRPTITRTKMPTEGRVPPAKADEHKGKDKDKDKDTDKEKEKEQEQWEAFLKNPEKTLLRCFPSQRQAATVMLVLDVLSSHSSEEEYLGQYIRPSWEVVPEIKEAFMRFKDGLHKLEEKINDRNKDEDLKHRCGAGILPYELLKPSSVQGVTGMGVPNSISI